MMPEVELSEAVTCPACRCHIFDHYQNEGSFFFESHCERCNTGARCKGYGFSSDSIPHAAYRLIAMQWPKLHHKYRRLHNATS